MLTTWPLFARDIAEFAVSGVFVVSALSADTLITGFTCTVLSVVPQAIHEWRCTVHQRMQEIDGTARFF